MTASDETLEQLDQDDTSAKSFAGGTVIEGWNGWSPGNVVMIAILVASFGLWAYAYSGFADRRAPDTFDDSSFAVGAETICAEAKVRYDELPNSLRAVDHHARADQIRQANAVLDDMIVSLERHASTMTGTERDRGITSLWLNRWRILLSDRADYAERLDQDPAALFFISEEAGFRAEKSIDYVANTNDMPSCTLPTDVG